MSLLGSLQKDPPAKPPENPWPACCRPCPVWVSVIPARPRPRYLGSCFSLRGSFYSLGSLPAAWPPSILPSRESSGSPAPSPTHSRARSWALRAAVTGRGSVSVLASPSFSPLPCTLPPPRLAKMVSSPRMFHPPLNLPLPSLEVTVYHLKPCLDATSSMQPLLPCLNESLSF